MFLEYFHIYISIVLMTFMVLAILYSSFFF